MGRNDLRTGKRSRPKLQRGANRSRLSGRSGHPDGGCFGIHETAACHNDEPHSNWIQFVLWRIAGIEETEFTARNIDAAESRPKRFWLRRTNG